MSDKKITVELTEDEARAFANIPLGDGYPDRVVTPIRDKVYAALLPEYPEGTVAFITVGDRGAQWIAVRRDGTWRSRMSGDVTWDDREVTKVEPLRVLADDEVAVKVARTATERGFASEDVRIMAREADGRELTCTAAGLRAFADALDAEATS